MSAEQMRRGKKLGMRDDNGKEDDRSASIQVRSTSAGAASRCAKDASLTARDGCGVGPMSLSEGETGGSSSVQADWSGRHARNLWPAGGWAGRAEEESDAEAQEGTRSGGSIGSKWSDWGPVGRCWRVSTDRSEVQKGR